MDTAQTAIALALKNGTTDFSQEIGPDWREHFDALATQLEYARSKGIPLGVMEMKSGGAANGRDNSGSDNESAPQPKKGNDDEQDQP